jgi:hypothetical protein
MEEEHPLEMERLEREGRLDAQLIAPPPRWLYIVSAIFGTAAILVGLTLAGLVIWASLR